MVVFVAGSKAEQSAKELYDVCRRVLELEPPASSAYAFRAAIQKLFSNNEDFAISLKHHWSKQ